MERLSRVQARLPGGDGAADNFHPDSQSRKYLLQGPACGFFSRQAGGPLRLIVPLGDPAVLVHANQYRGHGVDDIAQAVAQVAQLLFGPYAVGDIVDDPLVVGDVTTLALYAAVICANGGLATELLSASGAWT
jgi:hypothetical protein